MSDESAGAPPGGNPFARGRVRATSKRLIWMDRIASAVIAVGGIGTIVAIVGVMAFLLWVTLPLFQGGQVTEARQGAAPWSSGAPAQVTLDEYRVLGRALLDDGTVELFRVDTGEPLDRRGWEGTPPTSWALYDDQERIVFGLADGRVQVGAIKFATSFPAPGSLPQAVQAVAVGERVVHENGIVQRTPEGQLRVQRLAVELSDQPLGDATGNPVERIDMTIRPDGNPLIVAVNGAGALQVITIEKTENFMTGEEELAASFHTVALELGGRSLPDYLRVSGIGGSILLVWKDGHALRFDSRDLEQPVLAETLRLLPQGGAITACNWLIGRSTLLVGDDAGRTTLWFGTKPADASTSDGNVMTPARTLEGPAGTAVSCFGASSRSRLITVGYADGTMRAFHATSERRVVDVTLGNGRPVAACTWAPKEDAVAVCSAGGLGVWEVDDPHADASFKVAFRKVWYEGYNEPQHVWQSSSGTDDFEAKLGLMPLIFGSLKATLFSMLFGVPIALLAAIYTSEFMHGRLRAVIKPTIELMASLPSVVLGFLAALVFAPFVEDVVPAVLALAVTVPAAFIAGGLIWQSLPYRRQLLLERYRLLFMSIALPAGVVAAMVVGPLLESVCFSGDLRSWLDGQVGGATGGWFLLWLPAAAVAVSLGIRRWVSPWLRMATAGVSRERVVLAQAAKVVGGAAAACGLALLAGALITAVGFDARGVVLGTYVQRNALVVGFVMGFAIIPIIYTIAEDALSSVPNHLRLASLGAGATRWQTAVRVVMPTAMSGLFSAVMIGLGRAVGETMIVLMAAGNTPVMEWNVFNGFRTLSATIAVELPEAVRDSTHYRMLFLSALTLLVMTSVLNTGAEIVRLRFRKRAGAL